MPLALGRNEAGERKRCPVVRGIADCSAGTSHPRFHSVPQELVSCTEYSFRTGKACFLHRMPQKMRRVPQEPVLRTARIFRTIGGRFRYRMQGFHTTKCPSVPKENPKSGAQTSGRHFSAERMLSLEWKFRPIICLRLTENTDVAILEKFGLLL